MAFAVATAKAILTAILTVSTHQEEMTSSTTMSNKQPDQIKRFLTLRRVTMLRNWRVVKTRVRIRIHKMRS